jgi:2-keto-4-pentenoate hydratase/2-oxohepta-3-ene-1,7-dioic acid hydratase in catechol pathway
VFVGSKEKKMRLVTFREGTEERLGFLLDDRVLDPRRTADQAAEPAYASALAFIRAGEAALQAARRLIDSAPASALVPLSKVTITAPMRPSTLLCSGSNYRDHNKEKANTPISGKEPEFFVKTADSVVGPGEHIIYDPALTKKLDCETELAIVIGKPGRHIPAASALDHVFGYTIVNDVTARDVQVRHQQWDLGKSFDTFCPMGPWITSADEIDGRATRVRGWVNGELRQDGDTKDMIFDIATLIETCSRGITLYPGDVIATGTPSGVGMGFSPPRWLAAGDVVRIEIDGIGAIENRFEAR